MSSDDRNDPGPIWHGSNPSHWDLSSDKVVEGEAFFPYEQQQMASSPPASPFGDPESFGDARPESEEEEDEEDYAAAEPSLARDFAASGDFLQQAWYYVKLFLLPLLFGCITALLVL